MRLKYGDGGIDFNLPAEANVLRVVDPEIAITKALFADRLNAHLDGLQPDLERVAVVVADKTRLCGYPQYLPVLLDALAQRRARLERVQIYIAYGTHPPQSDAESRTAYGSPFDTHRFVHHDADDGRLFQSLGTTIRGTPIHIRKDILSATFLITFGAISHHYFAGYGGGRKLIFPGLGRREDIYRNHGLFLDPDRNSLVQGCACGLLDGNPLADDLDEVTAKRPVDMAIHGILDSHGRVCDLLVGRGTEHFKEACAIHGQSFELVHDRQYDLVIASAGGHPKDINFIQSHKAIHNAAAFVRDGGDLFVLARCPDGAGSKTFLPWFDLGGWDEAFQRLAEAYEGNGGTALATMAKTRRIQITMVTDLPGELCNRIEVGKLGPQEAVQQVKDHRGSLAVIPNASMVVRRL